MDSEAISIATSVGALAADVHFPEVLPAPVVVCCHGMLSSKNSMKYISIGQAFREAGIAVLRFDFSGCGESEASPQPNLITSRIRDLQAVLEYVESAHWAKGPTGLLGSSMGGYIALLTAASLEHEIRSVVCWASPFDLTKIHGAREIQENHRQILPGGVGIGFPLNLRSMAPVSGVLVIHGQEDEIVPWEDALDIYRQASEPRRVVVMRSADHRFLDPDLRWMATRLSLEWFLDHGFSSKPAGIA
jgi:alpha-beta hydrolase superfamily lysophospholipase